MTSKTIAFTLAAAGCLAGCAGSTAPSMPGNANAASVVSSAERSTTVTAKMQNEKPLKNVLIKLSIDANPPLIAQGRTNAKGEVVLTGTWTDKDNVCAYGFANHALSTLCFKKFPKTVSLYF
jgi:hypothetical protein